MPMVFKKLRLHKNLTYPPFTDEAIFVETEDAKHRSMSIWE
jgi:hypothetical protein